MNDKDLPVATGDGRPRDHRYNIAVYGESGSRKTTTTEEIFLAKKKRLIVLDTLCKDYGNPEFCTATGIRYDLVSSDLNEIMTLLASKARSGDFRIVARCPEHFETILTAFVYNEADKSALISDCTIAIEEISLLMDSTTIPPALADIIVRGRHSRINLVGVAQRPAKQTNPLYREQSTYIVSFQQTGKNSIEFFSDYVTDADNLRDLEPGRYRLVKGKHEDFLQFIQEP